MLAVLLLVGLAFAALRTARLGSSSFVLPGYTGPSGAHVVHDDAGSRSFFNSYVVPSDFHGLVATSEPPWVGLAHANPAAGRAALLARIEELRRRVPLAPEQRLHVPSWPLMRSDPTVEAARRGMLPLLRQLVDGPSWDEQVAAQLQDRAPDSLIFAADLLQGLSYQSAGDLRTAERLQRLLVDATGCEDLQLVADGDLTPAQLRQANQALAPQWRWFLNEFAHTPRTWRLYRQLLNR